MKSVVHTIKIHGKTTLLSILMLLLLLLLFTVLIALRYLPYSSADVLVITAVVAASFWGAYMTVKRCGEPMYGFVYGGTLFFVLAFVTFLVCGPEGFNLNMIKRLIAVFAGTILGNLLGRKRYYNLRNSGKRRRQTTK